MEDMKARGACVGESTYTKHGRCLTEFWQDVYGREHPHAALIEVLCTVRTPECEPTNIRELPDLALLTSVQLLEAVSHGVPLRGSDWTGGEVVVAELTGEGWQLRGTPEACAALRHAARVMVLG